MCGAVGREPEGVVDAVAAGHLARPVQENRNFQSDAVEVALGSQQALLPLGGDEQGPGSEVTIPVQRPVYLTELLAADDSPGSAKKVETDPPVFAKTGKRPLPPPGIGKPERRGGIPDLEGRRFRHDRTSTGGVGGFDVELLEAILP